MTYLELVIADGATHYYPLNHATTCEDGIGSLDGSPQGGTATLQLGAIPAGGQATVYDGVDDRVSFPTLDPATTGPCSIEVWFQVASAVASAYVWDSTNVVSSGMSCQLTATGIVARMAAIAGGAVTSVTATVTYADSRWHHLVVTLSRVPDTLSLYLDGELLGATVCASDGDDVTGSSQFCLGAVATGSDYLTGALDELAIYPLALSPAQIAAHHAYGATYVFRIRHGSLQVRDTEGDAPTTLSMTVKGERPPLNARVRIGVEPTTYRLAASIAENECTAVDVADADLLFEGTLQTVEEHYDGLRTQLAWACTATDHTYELNRLRPLGTFRNVAGHEVIETIMGTYAPDFDLAFVQQIEVPITIAFDGTLEMSACLSAIAAKLGSCHWYLDLFALHFYHVGINDGDVEVSPNPPGPPALTPPAGTGPYWAFFSMTFVYSNGLESQPSDSVLAQFSASTSFTALPIGAPFDGLPVVKRYLYIWIFDIGADYAERWFYVVPDNTSTTFTVSGPTRLRMPPTRFDPAPAPTTAPAFTTSGSSGGAWGSLNYERRFAVAYMYETGIESLLGPWSAAQTVNDDAALYTFTALPIGAPNVDGKLVVLRTLYYGVRPVGSSAPFPMYGAAFIPDNTSTTWDIAAHTIGGSRIYDHGGPVGSSPLTRYSYMNFTPPSGAPTFGPLLEDATPPDPLTDDSVTLIHNDPPLTSSEDATQLRTRVFVKGAATTITVATTSGSVGFEVASAAIFDAGGGQVLVDGTVYPYAYTLTGQLWFAAGLTVGRVIPIGTEVALWVQVDDYQAQAELGEREALAGVPSDGIREFTIVDTSLDTVAKCLARGYAELALYARPILTVTYGTFDRKTRAGLLVEIDLTDPPLQHDGLLIQEVTIDRFQVGPTAWPPRYTVTASSVRFTLDDLLRRVSLDR